jgi:USP6 N-terminal-like protein
VYKGIPDRWRAAAWFTLIEGKAKESSQKSANELKRAEMLGVEYRDSIDLPSTFDIQIDLDVPRTISGHVMFKTRYGMGYVQICFSIHFL